MVHLMLKLIQLLSVMVQLRFRVVQLPSARVPRPLIMVQPLSMGGMAAINGGSVVGDPAISQ